MANHLRQQFEDVKKTFFPRWDRKREWKVRSPKNLVPSGFCNTKRKIIAVQPCYEKDMLTLVLIHEICHAFGTGHGSPWLLRMERAAERAKEIGRPKLAKAILKEIEGYRRSPIVRAAHVYAAIEDAVCDLVYYGQNDLAYQTVVKRVGRDYGMTPKEFVEKFPRVKAVYDKALREARDQARLREEFIQKKSNGEICGRQVSACRAICKEPKR